MVVTFRRNISHTHTHTVLVPVGVKHGALPQTGRTAKRESRSKDRHRGKGREKLAQIEFQPKALEQNATRSEVHVKVKKWDKVIWGHHARGKY